MFLENLLSYVKPCYMAPRANTKRRLGSENIYFQVNPSNFNFIKNVTYLCVKQYKI